MGTYNYQNDIPFMSQSCTQWTYYIFDVVVHFCIYLIAYHSFIVYKVYCIFLLLGNNCQFFPIGIIADKEKSKVLRSNQDKHHREIYLRFINNFLHIQNSLRQKL